MERNEFVKALCNFQYWLHEQHKTISTSSVDMTERALNFVGSEGQNLPIFSVVGRLFRKLKAKCPNCADGRMHITDAHFTKNNKELNIYECDRCERRFV